MALSNRDTLRELEVLQKMGPKESALNFILNMQQLMIILSGWASVSVEIFIRFNFGERYLNLLRALLGYLIFRLFAGIIWMIAALPALFPRPDGITEPLPGNTILWFSVVYWSVVATQLLFIGWRNRQGIPWHSESFGVSVLSNFLPYLMPISRRIFGSANPEFLLYRAVEPVMVMLIGVLWLRMDQVMGTWIIMASLALLIRNNLVYNAQRHRLLDRRDAQIESQAYQLMFEQMEQGAVEYDHMNRAGYSVIPMSEVDLRTEIAERQDVEDVVAATMGTQPATETTQA